MLCGCNLQLKEMVLALLHESDLVLSDDVVETIVDGVKTTSMFKLFFIQLSICSPLLFIHILSISCVPDV